MKNYRFLVKFGEKEHLESLINKGELYCNTVKYFRSLDDPKQGDKNEGCTYAMPVSIKKLAIKDKQTGETHVFEKLSINGHYRENDPDFNRNIFCIYGADEELIQKFHDRQVTYLINRSEFDFGSHFVIIMNPKEFVDRVMSAVVSENYDCQFDEIEYVDHSSYSGDMGIFKKSNYYKDQNELRFSIHTHIHPNEPIKLFIDNIRDISSDIFPISALEDLKISVGPSASGSTP